MSNNRNNKKDKERQNANLPGQTDKNEQHINPFKDAKGENDQVETPQEEAALEQQRKETLTERD